MANLRFCDKHNMVDFLKKPTESEGFTEETATVRTLANGTQQIEASIDNKPYTITVASVRSKLQLAYATDISNLPDADIYAGLATLGPKSGGWDQFGSPLATALICLSSNRIYNFSKLIFEGMVNNIETDEATSISVEVDTRGATTTTSGLDAGLYSGNIHESPLRVKTLEVALKRKSKKVVLSDSEEEETEAQGRKIKKLDDDPLVSLVQGFVTPSKTSGEEQVEDKRPTTLEA
ncbi:hypothetical protein Tco_1278949, partial [Tanacetum coccineum]